MRRHTGVRRTRVNESDQRVAGSYEQTADHPSVASLYRSVAARMSPMHTIACTGLVGSTAPLDYATLVELATLRRNGDVVVSFIDLLACLGLSGRAELVTFRNADGEALTVPVFDLLGADRRGGLLLGSKTTPLLPLSGFPVRVVIPGWTDDVAPAALRSVHATTFAEFVRCS